MTVVRPWNCYLTQDVLYSLVKGQLEGVLFRGVPPDSRVSLPVLLGPAPEESSDDSPTLNQEEVHDVIHQVTVEMPFFSDWQDDVLVFAPTMW